MCTELASKQHRSYIRGHPARKPKPAQLNLRQRREASTAERARASVANVERASRVMQEHTSSDSPALRTNFFASFFPLDSAFVRGFCETFPRSAAARQAQRVYAFQTNDKKLLSAAVMACGRVARRQAILWTATQGQSQARAAACSVLVSTALGRSTHLRVVCDCGVRRLFARNWLSILRMSQTPCQSSTRAHHNIKRSDRSHIHYSSLRPCKRLMEKKSSGWNSPRRGAG